MSERRLGWLLFAAGAAVGARALTHARRRFRYRGTLVLITGGVRIAAGSAS
ncbi:MAG TPA: hypothetical protein VFT98_12695 [Myxococcota bacterium]|nr:hypothetical protein [Myxococcota bacterium]